MRPNLVKRSRELLPVTMTDAERLTHGVEIARLHQDADSKEAAAAETAKLGKEAAKSLRGKASGMQRELLSGEVLRSIEVETRYDFGRGVKETVRTDSGEIIRESVIHEEERQATIGEELPDDLREAFDALRADGTTITVGEGETEPESASGE